MSAPAAPLAYGTTMTLNLAMFLLMSLIWGLTWLAAKIGLGAVPPLQLAACRYLLTAAVLAPVITDRTSAFRNGRAARTIISALFFNTASFATLFWAMRRIPSGLAGLVNLSMIPVLIFALAIFTGEERPTWRHALALAVGCIGLFLLFQGSLKQGAGVDTYGLGGVILATAFSCIGTILSRPLLGQISPMTLTFAQALTGGLSLMALSLAFEPVTAETFGHLMKPAAWGSVIFLAILGTVTAYSIFLRLVRDWGSVRASLYAFVSPIVALLAGATLLGERLGPTELAGCVLLMSAAAVALTRRRPTAAAPAQEP